MKISNALKFKKHTLKSLHKNNYATISRVQNFDVEAFDFIPPPNIPQVVGKYKHPPQFPNEKNPHELLTSSQWCFRQLHLNRPEQGNTLNRSLVDKLRRALRLKEKGNVTKTLLLKGRFTQNAEQLLLPRVYDKAFCLGPDWGEIINNRAKGRMDLVHDFFKEQYQLSMQTYNFQKPLMALINGAVSSSGAGISFHCGLKLSTATSLFAMPETGFGFVPDCGQTFQMSRLEKNLGTYLALTGRRVLGFDLKHLGLATHHVIIGSENKMGEIVGNAWSGDYQKILHLMEIFECTATPFSLEPHIDIIDNCFGKDTVEEIIEALKGYYSPFATKTLQALQEKSPLSLKLTLEALRMRNREDLDLRQSMHNEWRAVKRLLDDPQSDLYIGLNSTVLAGRSYPQTRPRWNHASVSEVPQSLVESYFQPFGTAEEDDFIDEIQDRPLGELDQILSYLSHHRELLSEHKMPDYLEDVRLTDKQQKDLDSLVLEDEDDQDTLSENIVGDAETFYNAVVANRRFDDFDWNERERTITFECPVEFDFDRQIDKQLLDNIFLTAKAESIVTGKPMPDMTDYQAARDQIEESYSNMYLIDDISDFFDQWGSAEFAMEDEKARYRDLSKYNQHLSYIQAPQLYLEDHIEGYYFDEAVPIEKKYY